MQRPKIYASAVSNLSDARYFAAMGVDLIGFELSEQTDVQKIAEIISWVEGPAIAVEITEDSWTPKVLEGIDILKPAYLVLPIYWNDIPYFGEKEVLIKKYMDEVAEEDAAIIRICDVSLSSLSVAQLGELKSQQNVYLEAAWTADDVDFAVTHFPKLGMVIRGGEEEAPSIKSFDELDEFFERVESF